MPQPKSSSGSPRQGSTARKPAAKGTSAVKPAARRASSSSTSASKPAAGKATAAKPAAKKATASKPAAKKATAAKPAAKKATAAKPAAKRATGAKPAAKKATAAKPAARKATAAKPAAKRAAATGAAAKRTTSASSGSKARTTGTTRKAPAARAGTPAARDEQLRQNLAQLRDVLAQAVVIPAERVQAVLDDARKRGHIDAKGVQDIAGGLIEAGRKQADELRSEIEELVGRGRSGGDDLVAKVTGPARRATKRATQAGDPVLKQVDKVVRRTGLASFPITGYDDLKAAQIKDRLGDLSKPELRKVRTYETKNANRKAVLTAIEQRLA